MGKQFAVVSRKRLNALARQYGIELIVLFGSRVRGEARGRSDLDVGVWFEAARFPSPRRLGALEAQLLDLWNDDVHLVPLNFVNPELRVAVAREGQVLYERRAGAWVRFAVQNLHLLHDAQHLREYDDDLIERFLETPSHDKTLHRRRSAAHPRQSG
jgi:predicted nucleotidyltransferase